MSYLQAQLRFGADAVLIATGGAATKIISKTTGRAFNILTIAADEIDKWRIYQAQKEDQDPNKKKKEYDGQDTTNIGPTGSGGSSFKPSFRVNMATAPTGSTKGSGIGTNPSIAEIDAQIAWIQGVINAIQNQIGQMQSRPSNNNQ